jgi:hypothetical protein
MPGTIIASYVLGMVTTAGALTYGGMAVAFAINMVASAIIARTFAPDAPSMSGLKNNTKDVGNNQTVPPAGNNKVPVVYGTAYVGGSLFDMSITSNNQIIYYAIALSEVTNTENGGTGDTFTFGDIYWGGKKVVFDVTDQTKVVGLLDTSTGLTDGTVNGRMNIYLYSKGSNSPANSAISAITVMSASNLVYQWDASKLMTNCAFAIVKLQYSQTANIRGLDKVQFQITNSRTKPADCITDYLTSARYGAAIPIASIDTVSLAALNTYSDQLITYTEPFVGTLTKPRFRFNGVLDTTQPIMSNMQLMASSCDCLIKYAEITGKWGVVVQSPTYTVALALDDSNIISSLSISPIDISNSFNIAEIKFPDGTQQDAFSTVTIDLAAVAPSLLFPNEPVNKQQITLQLVNDNVRAQLLANRFLKACREDLQVQAKINYVGLQLDSGDIVTITNTNYGWTAKLFRIAKVVQQFGEDGSVTAGLTLMEYNPAVFNDASVTAFTPLPNTGLASPTVFGTVSAPTVTSSSPSATNPSFQVNVTASSAGIIQYAEVWYSAYATPTDAQRIFAGTTAIQADGNPYVPSVAMPPVTLTGIAAGNWYFFVRMVNGLASSAFSSASSLFQWRPTTFTYTNQFLLVAYGDSLTGTGFSSSPIGKNYYGLYNSSSSSFSTNPADYTWYLAQPTFGTTNKLAYINRTGRTFSFGTAPANYAGSTAAYVPTSTFDPSLWSALADGINFIDLDIRTGQLITTGTTTVGGGEIAITNNPNGTLVGSLAQFLDFGGASTYTGTAANITIDIYGRVVGLVPPDAFYYTSNEFVATAGQTVFTPPARNAGYINGQDLVFRNGALLVPTSEYTETTSAVTMVNACVVGDNVSIISFRAVSSGVNYASLGITYSSGTGTNTLTYSNAVNQLINVGDVLTFGNTIGATVNATTIVSGTWYSIAVVGTTDFVASFGASSNAVGVFFKANANGNAGSGSGSATIVPAQYVVSSVNYTTKQIVFTTTFTATAGNSVYVYRALGSSYRPYSRWEVSLSSASSYSPTAFNIVSGSEVFYLNGTIVNDQDYDLVSNVVNNFPAPATGNLSIIQFAPNNLGVPNGSPAITSTFTVNGQATYLFSYDANAFELYLNGCLGVSGAGNDYTTATGSYALNPTPTNNTTVLSQQTFSRTGAA